MAPQKLTDWFSCGAVQCQWERQHSKEPNTHTQLNYFTIKVLCYFWPYLEILLPQYNCCHRCTFLVKDLKQNRGLIFHFPLMSVSALGFRYEEAGLLVNLGLNCCEVPGKLSKMTFTHIKGSEDDKNLTGVWYRLRPWGFSLSLSCSSSCPPSCSRADVWTSTNLNGSVTIIREILMQELHQCLTHIKQSRMTSVDVQMDNHTGGDRPLIMSAKEKTMYIIRTW